MRSRGARRALSIGAVAAAGVLVLAGCTTDGGGGGGEDNAGTISVAVTNEFTSFNGETPQSNLDTNGMVGYLTGVSASLGLGGFLYLDPEFNIVHDESLGSYERVSEDPLVVKYTLKNDVTWSDGEPITADDMLSTWAINSGYFDDATLDPDSGDVVSGTQYFSLAGSTQGLNLTSVPEVGDDNRSITLTYSEPFVDWELVNMIGKPAHVLAEKAGVTKEELSSLIMELPKGDPAAPVAPNETLKAVADFWNTGYDVTAFPTDESLLVSSGPFIMTDYTPTQSVTLAKNPEYKGENTPAYDELVIRFIGDTNAQITALQNGEVNAIYPQPSADTLPALENANADVLEGDQLSYDHLDLNFGSEVFADKNVREAFLKTVPRQQILESIITPINPDAQVLNSQIYVPSNAEYTDAVDVNGYTDYAEPDIDGAKALLAGATPTVKILYNTENPNRVDAFAAIKTSAEEAGFVIEDGGSADWASLLDGGDYDASIFGWISPGAGNSALPQIFATRTDGNGGGNYNGYANPTVNELALESQTTLDEARLLEIKIEIDKATRADAYGLPLFQLPGVIASNGTISGLEYFGGLTGLVWNAQKWTLAE